MDSFTLGFPPDGQSVDPSSGGPRVPDAVREEVIRRYEAEYPGGYVLAFVDFDAGIAGFYTRTKEMWVKLDSIDEIVLYPTRPAKGSGFLIVGSQDTTPGWPNECFLSSSRYTELLHDWILVRAERFANLIGKPFREAMTVSDC